MRLIKSGDFQKPLMSFGWNSDAPGFMLAAVNSNAVKYKCDEPEPILKLLDDFAEQWNLN